MTTKNIKALKVTNYFHANFGSFRYISEQVNILVVFMIFSLTHSLEKGLKL